MKSVGAPSSTFPQSEVPLPTYNLITKKAQLVLTVDNNPEGKWGLLHIIWVLPDSGYCILAIAI